jgi:hypothetical protein
MSAQRQRPIEPGFRSRRESLSKEQTFRSEDNAFCL